MGDFDGVGFLVIGEWGNGYWVCDEVVGGFGGVWGEFGEGEWEVFGGWWV